MLLYLFLNLCLSQLVTPIYSSQCSSYPDYQCTGTEFYDKTTGFTNDTGYSTSSPDTCCQICLPGTPPTVCFDPSDKECASKTGNADYDYLLFDQIWIPQFCASVENGFDPTLTHMDGMRCMKDSTSTTKLSIHGLWPNYWNGYPQCCNSSSAPSLALVPVEVEKWDIYPLLQEEWADPLLNTECATCYMLNHEFLKHGGCYSPGNPYKYFNDTLAISSRIAAMTSRLNSFAGTTVPTSTVASLFPAAVNVLCDPHSALKQDGNTGAFLELRTCWSVSGEPIDCPPSSAGTFTEPCPSNTMFLE